MESEQPIQITVSMTRPDAYAFLVKLATDVPFRDRLEADPRGVLAENGIEFSPPEEDAVPENVVLPPMEEVARLLEEMGTPDESGRVDPVHLGRACYVILFVFGFGAMPFILPDGA
jgi:hypothetical protein